MRKRKLFFVLIIIVLSSCNPFPEQVEEDALPLPVSTAPAVATMPAASAGEPVVITYADNEVNRSAYEALMRLFHADNPDIRVQFVSNDQLGTRSRELGPQAYSDDLARLADTFPASEGPYPSSYLDLKPLIDADNGLDREDFYSGALEPPDPSDAVYIMPHRLTCFDLLGYNQQLWQAAGLQAPAPDWTWDELLSAAARVARKNGDEVEIYGLLLTPSQAGSLLVDLLKQSNIDIFAPTTSLPAFDSPEVTAAFNRLADLVAAGVLAPPSLSDGGETSLSLLQAQRVGMWSTDLTGQSGFNALNYPVSMARIASDFPCTNIGYAASVGTQHPQAAYRWLSFLSRQPFGETSGATIGDVPARKSVAEATGYWKRMDEQSAAVMNSVLVDYARTRGSPDFFRLAGFEAIRYARALDSAVAELGRPNTTPQQLLNKAQQQFDQQIAQGSPTPAPTPNPAPIVVATPAPQIAVEAANATIFGVPASLSETARDLADQFNQAEPNTPITIETISPGRSPYEQAARFECFTWLRPPSPREASQLLDLQPLIDADATFPRDDYLPGLFAPFQRNSKLYGIPVAWSPRVVAYNPVLFEQAGIERPQPDWTQEQFLATAEQLTDRNASPPRYGFVGNRLDDVQTFVGGAGAQLVLRDNRQIEPNFTDATTQAAINQFVALTRNASPYNRVVGYARAGKPDDVEPETLIANNQVAMWYEYATPSAAGSEQQSAFAPLPRGNTLDIDSMIISGMSIHKRAKSPEACWQFMRQLVEQPVERFGFAARRSLAEQSVGSETTPAGIGDVYQTYSAMLESDNIANLQATDEEQTMEYFWVMRAVDRILDDSPIDQLLAEAQAYTDAYLACMRDINTSDICPRQVDSTYRGYR